jgi:hypothetical protein
LKNFIIGLEFFDEKNLKTRTDLYLDWISKRKIFVKNLCINEWNIPVSDNLYSNNVYVNNRNSFLKSLTFKFNYYNYIRFNEIQLLELFDSKNFKNLIESCFLKFNFNTISDLTLICVSKNCKFLKVLNLDNCKYITD